MGQTFVKEYEEKPEGTTCQKYPIIGGTMISVFTIAVFLGFGLLYSLAFNDSAKVLIENGQIEGFIVSNLFGRDVKVYYGIPYAEPPIGNLRFEKTVPKKRWNKLLKADKQPNACPQSFDGIKNLVIDSLWNEIKTINISEDCLYLNVYVPTAKEKNPKRVEYCGSNKKLRTVMVYFHGGSFLYGANSFKFFDATNLAAFGEVVVVVPNYRLGILGFLSSYPEINGNFGLYDQLEALKWVQKNIAAFGGDPDRVVLFGQNAGAVSIGLHLISPLSKNLFRRAILESGNPLSWHTLFGQKHAKVFAIKVANTSSCPLSTETDAGNETEISINDITIDCLRNIAFPKLIDIQNKVLAKMPFNLFTPVVDGEFLTDPPMDIVDNLKFGPYSELLIGSNAMEGESILRTFSDKFNISLEKMRKNFTKPVIKKFLMSRVPQELQEYIDLVLGESFPTNEINVNNSTQMWFQFVKIVGDLLQVCTDEYFIEKFTESGRNIYYYQFKHRPSKISLFNSTKWFDLADDFDETPIIFGYPFNKKNSYTNEENLLSKKLMTFWTRFAKKGKPVESDIWPIFDSSNPKLISFNVKTFKLIHELTGFKCGQYYRFIYNENKQRFSLLDFKNYDLFQQNITNWIGV